VKKDIAMSDEIKKKTVKNKSKSLSLSKSIRKSNSSSVYEKDFYKWAGDQSKFLKQKEFSKLDIENLIEEIESLGRSERRALESRFVVLLKHLLKREYQKSHSGASWESSINVSRFHIKKLLKENPSLKSKTHQIFKDAYTTARFEAIQETKLDAKLDPKKFPEKCPWTLEECMSESESTVSSKKGVKTGLKKV
jgi:hypothetical protein